MQDSSPLFVSASDNVKIWDVEHMKSLKQYNCQDLSSGSNFKDVAWNFDNTALASVSTTAGIVLYDWSNTNGNNVNEFQELSKSKEQTSVCFGSTGTSLFSGGTTGDINLWNCQTGKRVKTFNECHLSPVKRIDKIGQDRVVSACASGEIIVWAIDSGSACLKLKATKSQSVRGLEQSPWVRSVLGTTSDDGAVYIWDTEKQETKHTFKSHDAPAMDLSFSPLNHLLLASCGLDKKVIFYDIQGNNVVKTINSSQPLTAVCFLSNGVHVCAGSSMGNIYKYDLRKTEEPLNSIHAHSTSVQRLVLQTVKHKTHRKSSRSSRTSSTNPSAQKKEVHHKDELKTLGHDKMKHNLRLSQDQTKNRRSWSNKVPDIEVPSDDLKVINGDGHSSPARSIPIRKSVLEKTSGLQTPMNRSAASSRRDTMGSYCEGIFSPVVSVNDSIQDDAAFTPADHSQNQPQRTSRGTVLQNMNPYSSFHYNTPAAGKGGLLQDRNSDVNGVQTSTAEEETSMARGSISGHLMSSSHSSSKRHHSTPTNGATASSSSLSPDSDGTSEKLQNEDTSVNTLVNGGTITTSSATIQQPDFTQSNPFQYQLDFLQNTVRELVEEHEDNIRDELRHLHMQFIKMFAEQNERIRQLAEQSSVNPLLLQEIERLRTENDRLRRKY